MLNLSGTQCHALILRGEEENDFDMLQLDVTEKLAAGLQVTLRDGLDQLGLRARGDAPENHGAASTAIERVLNILWDTVVKPLCPLDSL